MASLFGPPNIGKFHKDKNIRKLIKALDYKDAKIQQQAMDTLVTLGKDITEHLVRTLSDSSSVRRKNAAVVLENIEWRPEEKTEQFMFFIAKEQWNKLYQMDNLATVCNDILNDENQSDTIQILAIAMIGIIHDSSTIDTLVKLINKERIGDFATFVLVQMGDHAIPFLKAILNDPANIFEEYRELFIKKVNVWRLSDEAKSVLMILSMLGEPAIETLINFINTTYYPEPKVEALAALAGTGYFNTKDLIDEYRRTSEFKDLRMKFVHISYGPSPETLKDILDLIRNPPDTIDSKFLSFMSPVENSYGLEWFTAVNVIGNCRYTCFTRKFIKKLKELKNDCGESRWVPAINALAKIGDIDTRETLISYLYLKDGWFEHELRPILTIIVLSNIKNDRSIIDGLNTLINDKNIAIRTSAAFAIEHLK